MRSRIVTSSLAAISLVLGFSTAFAEEPNRDCRTYEALDHLENGNLGGHRFEVDLASSPIIAVYSEYFGGTRAFTIGFAGTLVGETLHLIGQSSCTEDPCPQFTLVAQITESGVVGEVQAPETYKPIYVFANRVKE